MPELTALGLTEAPEIGALPLEFALDISRRKIAWRFPSTCGQGSADSGRLSCGHGDRHHTVR